MKNYFLLLFVLFLYLSVLSQNDCFKKLEDENDKRVTNAVGDGLHSNVTVSFFEETGTRCVGGKVRVENWAIISVFFQLNDNAYVLMEKKFYNAKRNPPAITNGISEMIFTADGEKFRIIFVEKLKSEQQGINEVKIKGINTSSNTSTYPNSIIYVNFELVISQYPEKWKDAQAICLKKPKNRNILNFINADGP